MADLGTHAEIYRLHVLLRDVYPPVWRRLLVRSDSTIADLHFILPIAFDWSDAHLHCFRIRGRHYGIGRAGGIAFGSDAHAVRLAEFRFRRNERFLYEYDFGDFWQHPIRFEGMAAPTERKTYPAYVRGAGTVPPEDCGGAEAYAVRRDERLTAPPLQALQVMAEAMARVVDAKDDAIVREVIGDLDALQRAVEEMRAYDEADRVDRRRINRRLRQYAAGDDGWRSGRRPSSSTWRRSSRRWFRTGSRSICSRKCCRSATTSAPQ